MHKTVLGHIGGGAFALLMLGCGSDTTDSPDLAAFTPLRLRAEGVHMEKARLGQALYDETALSADGRVACASCHRIADGGDDDRPVSTGIGGQRGGINSPTVLNAFLNFVQFWDGRAADLAEQAAGPVVNPIEMGRENPPWTWDDVVARLASTNDPMGMPYSARFDAVYTDGITQNNVTDAIAEFERTLVTPNDRFDQYLRGDESALNDQEIRGLSLFVSHGCADADCHAGEGLGGTSFQQMGAAADYFALRGGPITEADAGRFNVTGNERDRHFFKVPLLRNIARTAPYFHDGSAASLSEAVTTMAKVQLGLDLPVDEVDAIVAFLRALDGELPSAR